MITPSPFALGSNGQGQLGLGHTEDVSIPKPVNFYPIPPTSSVKKIAAGGNHTLIMTEDGEIWAAGNNNSGACGNTTNMTSPEEEQSIPQQHVFRKCSPFTNTSHIACTWTASIIVHRDDKNSPTQLVSSVGTGLKGELGRVVGPNIKINDFPPPGTTVVDLASSLSHVVAVLSDGTAWGWGAARKGQLGFACEPVVGTPRKIPNVGGFAVQRAICGKDFTILFGAPESGDMLVLGDDKSEVKKGAPTKLPSWKDVGAGWSSVYILTENDEVLSWGRDAHGQLTPPGLSNVVEMAVGSEHVVALTEEGEVVSWGWGEHGNCGPGTGDGGVVKGKWNVLANSKFLREGSRITGLGAGCATSWIIIETQGLVI